MLTILALITTFAALVAAAFVGFRYLKSIKTHMNFATERSSRQFFRQLEALMGIYQELDLHRALPPTRNWAASPDILSILMRHLADHGAERYVECGSGVSTIIAARAMQIKNSGHAYSLDHDPVYAAQTRAELSRFGLAQWATVVDAPLVEQAINGATWKWYDRAGIPDGPFDVIFIDGPPGETTGLARYPAGPVLLSKMSRRGVLILDDADRPDEIAIVARWLAETPGLKSIDVVAEKGCTILSYRQP